MMKGLILSGGLGTRLRPLTHTGAKQLIPIANKPVLHHVIEDLASAGIKDVGIIVGYDKIRIDSIIESIGNGSKFGIKVTYIVQDAPRGLAHAVGIAQDFLGDEDFVLYLGDNLLKSGIKSCMSDFRRNKPHINLLLAEHNEPHRFGVAVLDDKGNVIDVEEKPKNPKSNFVITGVYIFTKEIFDAIKKVKPGLGGELQITDAIKIFVDDPTKKVIATKVDGWWDDAGTANAILNANLMVLIDKDLEIKGSVSSNSVIQGKLGLGKSSIIYDGCYIKGPVIIGENCEIGPNTYIGPYTSIGDGCKIKGGEIESSIVIGESNIILEKGDKICDSLIGKGSKISSRKNLLPMGHVFVLGENSELGI